MTTAAVRKNLAEKLMRILSQEKETALIQVNKGRSRPQLLVLKDLNFINYTIRGLLKTNGLPTSQKEFQLTNSKGKFTELHNSKLEEARKIAKRRQDTYVKTNKSVKKGTTGIRNTPAGYYLAMERPQDWSLVESGEAFVVTSFGALRNLKKEIVQLFFDETHKNYRAILEGVDRGHGGLDSSRKTGLAKSAVETASSLSVAQEEIRKRGVDPAAFEADFFEHVESAIADETDLNIKAGLESQLQIIKDIYIDYEKVVTKSGKVRVKYIPIIEFQAGSENSGSDAAIEKRAKEIVGEFFEKINNPGIASLEGSATTEEQVFASVIQKFTVGLKNADIEIILDKKVDPRKVKSNVKGSSGKVKNTKKTQATVKTVKAVAYTGKARKSKRTKAQGDSPIRLMALINAKLPQTVAGNMGEPRLVNRTGRFAGSARVTNITATPQGYPSIGYSYETNPYGVFEKSSGTRFASADRDPRTLIDASIREIATQLIAGRFYTRRI